MEAYNKPNINWKYFTWIAFGIWMFQAIYTSLSTIYFSGFRENSPPWMAVIIYNFSDAIIWFLMTPLILMVANKYSFTKERWLKSLLIHLCLGLGFSAIHRLFNALLTHSLITGLNVIDEEAYPLSIFFGINFIQNTINGMIVYFVIVAVLSGYLYFLYNLAYKEKQSKLEADLNRIQLENLKYQLQPHFLFNSLQAITTVMQRDVNQAEEAIGELGDLLRYSLNNIGEEATVLDEEIMMSRKYIGLQERRFGDLLTVNLEYDEHLKGITVPLFILQPLIENSIKYGIESTGEKLKIEISIKEESSYLYISCKDDGPGLSSVQSNKGNGIGIKNLKERLNKFYDRKAHFNIGPNEPKGCKVELRFPLKKT